VSDECAGGSLIELFKFVSDPRERIARSMAYLCRLHQDSEWASGWAVELWLLVAGRGGHTNIGRCDLSDMKMLAERAGVWMLKPGQFVTLEKWRDFVFDEAANG
jgi:hypothetical protein